MTFSNDNESPRTPFAQPGDGTAHDVTVLYDPKHEHYFFIPNNERALTALLTVSAGGCEGLQVGQCSPHLPWFGGYFLAQHLADKWGLSLRERIVEGKSRRKSA